MTAKKEKEESFIPENASKYKDNTRKKDKDAVDSLHREFDSKDADIPPLSQQEQEHLTYLMVLDEYNSAKRKRNNYRRYGALAIIISGIVFLALIFSLETKIEFLSLWVVTIIYCVAVMISAEYNYHRFKVFLGIADEYDYYGMDSDEDEGEDDDNEKKGMQTNVKKNPQSPPLISNSPAPTVSDNNTPAEKENNITEG